MDGAAAEQVNGAAVAAAGEQDQRLQAETQRRTTAEAELLEAQVNADRARRELDETRARLQAMEQQLQAQPPLGGLGGQAQPLIPQKVQPGAHALAVAQTTFPPVNPGIAQPASLRLVSVWNDHGVSDFHQQKLAAAGIDSLQAFASLGTGRDAHDQLREFLSDMGIDPALETDRAARVALKVEISKIAGAFDTANIKKDVQVRENAQREAAFMPRVIPERDWKEARKHFERVEYKLADEVAPSKPYLERLTKMLDDGFEAEPLTTVTTMEQEKVSQSTDPQPASVDSKGFFRVSLKPISVHLPKDSEAYRLRLETWGANWCYLRYRNPHIGQLRTVCMDRVFQFQRWLFGPKCWGKIVKGPDGRALSSPTMAQIMDYEYKLRKLACEKMDEGYDWWAALEYAMAGEGDAKELREDFRETVAVHVATKGNLGVSAPGVSNGAASSNQPPPGGDRGTKRDAPPPPAPHDAARPSKNSVKRAKAKAAAERKLQDAVAKARADANHAAKRHKGPGAKGADPKGKGKGAKGKGVQSQFPDGCMHFTPPPENKAICVKYNLGTCNYGDGCRYAHACWWCGDATHTGPNHPQ